MSFNVFYSTTHQSTTTTIRESGADIIGLQEISVARMTEVAQQLGYFYHSFGKTSANLSNQDTGILSRFKIVQVYSNGVVVQVNKNLQVAIFTCHLSPYPYQPYDFRDGKISTPSQAVASASFRLDEIDPMLDELEEARAKNIPVFITGDFNEPSHLDWTIETANTGLHFGKAVAWPVSSAIVLDDWVDVWRLKMTSPLNFPGITWTPFESANEVYDRIDIIYQNQTPLLTLSDIRSVAGMQTAAGIKVSGYESDHYAVIATYEIKP